MVDLALLTELNRRIGLRDYVAEVDPVQAAALNVYLDTGDERWLTRVFARWKNRAQWGNTAFMAKVRGVRALNEGLAASRRIRFIGLDAVQDWPLLSDWLQRAGANPDLAALEAAKTEAQKAALASGWLAEAAGGDPAIKARLALTLRLGARQAGREQTIFESYETAVRSGELGDRQAYGLWGLFHILQTPVQGGLPFAARVRASDLPAARSLRTIALFGLDSATLIPGRTTGMRMTTLNADGPAVQVQGAAALRAASRLHSIVLWRLEGRGSPFAVGGDLVALRTTLGQSLIPADGAAGATAAFQYAGVFRGSDWAAPIP